MNREISPGAMAPPAANYAHAMLSDAPGRLLHTSGVVPVAADGSVPTDLAEQAATVWGNIGALLAEAGMQVTDIVSVTTYVVEGSDLAVVMAARDHALGDHRAASTLLVVPRLAQDVWRMEVAVVAAASS